MSTVPPRICPGAIPVALTPLVGRARERAVARVLLQRPDVRLLTLTGAGGVGKARLARQIAAEAQPEFRHGVVFVPLSSLTDPALVLSTIQRVLAAGAGTPESPAAATLTAVGMAAEPGEWVAAGRLIAEAVAV